MSDYKFFLERSTESIVHN